jgi:HPr kinase/phosphorylase
MAPAADPVAVQVHASAVSVGGSCVLILGRSGSGKSALALQLMAHGATLVADDWTDISVRGGRPFASAPAAIRGRIEARGIGLLAAETVAEAEIRLVVDLDQVETDRLPPERVTEIAGVSVPCVHRSDSTHFAAAILQYLKAGRTA